VHSRTTLFGNLAHCRAGGIAGAGNHESSAHLGRGQGILAPVQAQVRPGDNQPIYLRRLEVFEQRRHVVEDAMSFEAVGFDQLVEISEATHIHATLTRGSNAASHHALVEPIDMPKTPSRSGSTSGRLAR